MFRFTIRDVLWLTVVVAMALGWWLDRKRAGVRLERVGARAHVLEEMLYEVGFDIEWTGDRVKGTSAAYEFDWQVDKSPKPIRRQRPLPKP